MPPQHSGHRHLRVVHLHLIFLIIMVLVCCQVENPAALAAHREPDAAWLVQLGTAEADEAVAVAVSAAGDIFAAGNTSGSLGGEAAGEGDIWVARFDSQGGQQWLHQFGGPAEDRIAALALAGDDQILVGGAAGSKLFAELPADGGSFLLALTSEGEERWHARLPHHRITSMVANGDAVYVAGLKMQAAAGSNDRVDAVVSALTLDGEVAWTTEVAGGVDDAAVVIAALGDALVVSGAEARQGDSGNSALWVAELDRQGKVNRRGAVKLGASGYTAAPAAFFDSGKAAGFLVGAAAPVANPGSRFGWRADSFVSQDKLLWSVQELRTGAGAETIAGLTAHAAERAWVSGLQADFAAEDTQLQPADAWLGEIDANGQLLWIASFGSSGEETVTAPVAAPGGMAVIAGSTDGDFGAVNAGASDAWLMKVAFNELGLPQLPAEALAPPAEAQLNDEEIAGDAEEGAADSAAEMEGGAAIDAQPSTTLTGQILFAGSHEAGQDTMAILVAPHELYTIQADGSALTPLPGAGMNPWKAAVASPTGELVARASMDNTPVQIVNAAGETVAEVEHPGKRAHPTDWSADGRSILFSVAELNAERYEDLDLWTLSYPGMQWVQITSDNESDDYHASWSPGGEQIAVDRDSQLWVLNADGTGGEQIIEADIRFVSWSPDGRSIAYQAMSSDPALWDLWIVAPDGSGARNVTDDSAWSEENPDWSPDGSALVYDATPSDNIDGLASLFVVDVATGEKRLLYEGGNNLEPQWISGAPGSAIDAVIAAAPGQSLVPALEAPVPAGGVGTDADGVLGSERLGFLYEDSLWTMRADGGELNRLVSSEQFGPVHAFTWLPNNEVAFLAGDPEESLTVYTTTVEGGAAGALLQDVKLGKLAWADGKLVLMYNEAAEGDSNMSLVETKLAVYDLSSDPARTSIITGEWVLGATEPGFDSYVTSSADGQWVLFVDAGMAGVARLDGWTPLRGFGHFGDFPQWAGPRVEVTYTQYDGSFMTPYYLDPSLAGAVPVPLRMMARYVQVSPDGREMAAAGDELLRVNLNSSVPSQTITPDRAAHPRWSPSGSVVLYRRVAYNPELISMGKPAPWWESFLGYYVISAQGKGRMLVLPDNVFDLAWQPQSPSQDEQASGQAGGQDAAAAESGVLGVGVVSADPLNLRSSPSTDATVLTQLSEGTKLTILQVSADEQWLRVRFSDGVEGWVAAQFVNR